MQIKSLEISGFKSFGKKVVISLDSQITSIVGPNGSGKSNVAEAIRFVLGEQSIKSMRGKQGTDFIFKGSQFLPPLGRASVTAVFDNNKKSLGDEGSTFFQFLQYDEIRVTREIYADGQNEYYINDTKVRLKDIQEMLSLVGIGVTGHHIISQGEADKVLNSSILERKEMIEEALGLKLYTWRIKETERKLEKTENNLREGEMARREIMPHLNFLKKQVEKIDKRKEQVESLKSLYGIYLKKEVLDIDKEKEALRESGASADLLLEHERINKETLALRDELAKDNQNLAVHKEIEDLENKKGEEEKIKYEYLKKLAHLEAQHTVNLRSISKLQTQIELSKNQKSIIFIEKDRATETDNSIKENIEKAQYKISKSEFSDLSNHLNTVRSVSRSFFDEILSNKKEEVLDYSSELNTLQGEVSELEKETKRLSVELELSLKNIQDIENQINKKRESLAQEKESFFQKERAIFENSQKASELLRLSESIKNRENILLNRERRFEEELAEGAALIGSDILFYKKTEEGIAQDNVLSHYELFKNIERLKIKLEESGVSNVSDIMNEYRDVSERDQFLSKEITDLIETQKDLETIIADLKEKLSIEFTSGVEKINRQFDIFFKQMFGGGEASISLIEKEKRGRKKESDDETLSGLEEMEGEIEKETGIDVQVSLPSKKVRDLSMLSGGERALTSIALLFAISQVTPPPFMVLDETDAALDEANARRYGAILKLLSVKSKLIVITHNRETMNQADSLYGVTVSKDGASKVLSVKFEEANMYAK